MSVTLKLHGSELHSGNSKHRNPINPQHYGTYMKDTLNQLFAGNILTKAEAHQMLVRIAEGQFSDSRNCFIPDGFQDAANHRRRAGWFSPGFARFVCVCRSFGIQYH